MIETNGTDVDFNFFILHMEIRGVYRNPNKSRGNLLLLRHTDGATATASCLRVLTADAKSPVVTHSSVGADLLQTFQILTQLRVDQRRCQLSVLAVDDVLLSVQEPVRDLVLTGVGDDCDDLFDLKNKLKLAKFQS